MKICFYNGMDIDTKIEEIVEDKVKNDINRLVLKAFIFDANIMFKRE